MEDKSIRFQSREYKTSKDSCWMEKSLAHVLSLTALSLIHFSFSVVERQLHYPSPSNRWDVSTRHPKAKASWFSFPRLERICHRNTSRGRDPWCRRCWRWRCEASSWWVGEIPVRWSGQTLWSTERQLQPGIRGKAYECAIMDTHEKGIRNINANAPQSWPSSNSVSSSSYLLSFHVTLDMSGSRMSTRADTCQPTR